MTEKRFNVMMNLTDGSAIQMNTSGALTYDEAVEYILEKYDRLVEDTAEDIYPFDAEGEGPSRDAQTIREMYYIFELDHLRPGPPSLVVENY